MATKCLKRLNFYIPDTTKTKMKLMLWIEKETLRQLEEIRPAEITLQECIRQILKDYLRPPQPLKVPDNGN